MEHKGDTWNESSELTDPATGRTVRRLTSAGEINYKAPYHTRTTFTDDSRYLVMASYRNGASALCRIEADSGEITCLIEPVRSATLTVVPGTLAPRGGWQYYWHERTLKGVNVVSLEERTLIEDLGEGWSGALMSVDPTEELLATAVTTTHPDSLTGDRTVTSKAYREHFPDGEGLTTRILQVSVDSLEVRELYREERVKCAHLEYSPVDADLVYLDRDLPPNWWAGGDNSKTARCHILRLSTGELTALTPAAEAKFQIHAVWSWNGDFIYYHGPAVQVVGPCPWYIGAVRPSGEIYREWVFEDGKNYGHVAAAPDRPAIIIDGNTSKDLLQWLYIDDSEPRFEVIGVHGTEWGTLPGQLSHPHPSTDGAGKYVAYNVASGGRSDVFLIEV